MFGRKARNAVLDLQGQVREVWNELKAVEERIARLERLMEVGTTRLDLHAQRLGTLEDDVENLK